MAACITGEGQIEDLRYHPAETILSLRDLLSGGALLVPDPKRRGFYEVESGSVVYYIHVSGVTGNVLLLATWPKDAEIPGENRFA